MPKFLISHYPCPAAQCSPLCLRTQQFHPCTGSDQTPWNQHHVFFKLYTPHPIPSKSCTTFKIDAEYHYSLPLPPRSSPHHCNGFLALSFLSFSYSFFNLLSKDKPESCTSCRHSLNPNSFPLHLTDKTCTALFSGELSWILIVA